MTVEKTKQHFEWLNESVKCIAADMSMSYLEALHETLQNIVLGEVQQFNQEPSDQAVQTLKKIYSKEQWEKIPQKEKQELLQLLYLEGERQDQLPTNYQVTPSAIGILVGFFVTRLITASMSDSHKRYNILDPTFGTGNLWRFTLEALGNYGLEVTGQGMDNDDLMLAIGEQSNAWLGFDPTLFLGDALQDSLLEPADFVISDLPIGYYPLDEVAQNYKSAKLKNKEAPHALAHYLLIEQSLRLLKENGWGIFIIPRQMMMTEEASPFIEMIQGYGYLQAFLTLPQEMFRQQRYQKAILILQKAGDNAKQAQNVLIGDIPDLKDRKQMKQFSMSFSNWTRELTD